jgi:hypothetical protein
MSDTYYYITCKQCGKRFGKEDIRYWKAHSIGYNHAGFSLCRECSDPRTPAEREQDDLAKEWSQMTEQLRNGG